MKRSSLVGILVVGVAVALYGAYRFGEHQAATAVNQAAPPPTAPSSGERKVLYWHDPMVPGQRFDKPGKSPFMDMPLVPVYADEAQAGGVAINPTMAQNLGVRTTTVRRGQVETQLDAQGVVAQNDRATVVVQSRGTGYVEKLYVRAPLDAVGKGQRLVTIYVPEWAGALTEYVALRKASIDPAIVGAARERLRLLSIPDDAVLRAEREAVVDSRFTLTAPIGGVVAELGAREGMQVQPGMMLFRIVDLSSVWVEANVPEGQAGAWRVGSQAQVKSDAYPDRTFTGTVAAILPQVDAATRTLRARIELRNPGTVLKPGMFVRVSAQVSESRQVLVIPQEAVISTGRRNVVITASDGNRFEAREITLGRPVGNDVEVKQGLSEGQRIVTSSQFLIDSEASLKAVLPRLTGQTATSGQGSASYHAEGRIEKVEPDGVTISHGPVPALQWPAMTMQFKSPPSGLPANVASGDRVAFDFVEHPDGYRLTQVKPVSGAKP